LKFLKKNWFILGIFTALLLGTLFSDFGTRLNTGSHFSTLLVVIIFVITGVKLPVSAIRNGLKDIRVHIYIQLFIFALVPAYFYFSSMLFKRSFGPEVMVGIYALACLPCTISSCIVFTQSSGGNVVATVFNAAFANVIGVIVSPLLLSLMLRTSAGTLPAGELAAVFKKLVLMMLVPIAGGQLLRFFVARAADRIKKELGVISNVFILMILFFAFSKSAGDPLFTSNLRSLLLPYIYLALSFLLLNAAATGGAVLLNFKKEDRISVTFTAPKKTLAMGVPLLSTYFASNPELLGIALLPLIFYHPWQLFISGLIQNFINRKN